MALTNATLVQKGKVVGGCIPDNTASLGNKETVGSACVKSGGYYAGDYFVDKTTGLFYTVTARIAQGGTITAGTNCTQTNVGNELTQINTDLTWKKLGNYSGNATFSLPSNFQELYIQVRNDANEWRASTVILEDTIDGSTTTYIGFGSAKMFASAYMTKTTGKINTVEWEGTATSNYTVFVYYR